MKKTDYETVIGLEVHAQLLTRSKIFCACSTEFGALPNTQTCPVCLGMPGALPVLNKKVVEYAVKLAVALHCDIQQRSLFSRKNYFYPDLPKGYQISQFDLPLAENGWMSIDMEDGSKKRIQISRIHIEEDAGKLIHDEAYVNENESLIDFNRCGVPLVEIVSEPDIRSPGEAHLYLLKIRQIVRWLGICDGNMEEGSLRCDANISIRQPGAKKQGVKVEIKNLNSFRAVERSLAFEEQRHSRILTCGERVVRETMMWDESEGVTVSIRRKEEDQDYRYFTDPDLTPLVIPEEMVEEIRRSIPELPEDLKHRWIHDLGLSDYAASILTEERDISNYFKEVTELVGDVGRAANWMMSEVLGILNKEKWEISQIKMQPRQFAEIIQMVMNGTISNSTGKKVLHQIAHSGEDPKKVVDQLNLVQISKPSEIEKYVDQILKTHPEEVEKFLKGSQGVFDFLVGQVMKIMKGRANPGVLNDLLRSRLESMKN
jgi:aspartyl-tRNA(Asn)/glutamyl-tRNA(Gln) amidotransferase subunit B